MMLSVPGLVSPAQNRYVHQLPAPRQKKTEGLIGFTKSAAKIVSQPLGSRMC